jgi:hypothetical protein
MFMETYRVYNDNFLFNFKDVGIACQVVCDDPDLTIEFVRNIPGVKFAKATVSYTRWYGKDASVVTFRVTKGLEFIPRTIPPYTYRLGMRWSHWRTLDRLKKKCK